MSRGVGHCQSLHCILCTVDLPCGAIGQPVCSAVNLASGPALFRGHGVLCQALCQLQEQLGSGTVGQPKKLGCMIACPLSIYHFSEEELLKRAAVWEKASVPEFWGEAGDGSAGGHTNLKNRKYTAQ